MTEKVEATFTPSHLSYRITFPITSQQVGQRLKRIRGVKNVVSGRGWGNSKNKDTPIYSFVIERRSDLFEWQAIHESVLAILKHQYETTGGEGLSLWDKLRGKRMERRNSNEIEVIERLNIDQPQPHTQ